MLEVTNNLVLTCLDENLDIVGYVDEFKSFSWGYSYAGIGKWTLTAPISATHTRNVLKASQYIVVKNIPSRVYNTYTGEPQVSGIITEIREDYKPSGDTFTVSGLELKGIANRRIMLADPTTHTNKLARVIMMWGIVDNITSPSDSNRQILGGTTHKSTNSDDGEYPDQYSNLADALQVLGEAHDIGWEATIDQNATTGVYGISWFTYDGYDRTGDDADVDPIYLSFDNDTLNEANYKINMDALQNFAYIGGSGTGSSRTIKTTYDTDTLPTGVKRYETFVEASNEGTDTTKLTDKGQEALSQYESTDTITVKPSWGLLKKFGTNYYIGDLFLFSSLNAKMRLTEGTLTFEGNEVTCTLTFGYRADDMKSAMRIMLRNYKNMVNA